MKMSLSSLVTEEIRRTEKQFLREQAQPRVLIATKNLTQKLNLTGTQPEELEKELVPLATAEPTEHRWASNAFDSLANYIPTEAVTLYVAATSAMLALTETFAWITEAGVYWSFVCLTPILFLIIFCGKRREANLSLFPQIAKWPWWKLIASTVAFAVWALAIPTTPYLQGAAGGAVAAFGAVFVSTVLTLLQPIFERKTE
jgi:hypothetical protein